MPALLVRHLRLVLGLLVALTGLGLATAPAQAAPRIPDPEQASPRAQHAERRATASAVPALPAKVDSDVYAYAISPNARTYFVTAGHLTLHLKKGSATSYQGTFSDYVGTKSSKATVDATHADHPVLTIKGSSGRFRFTLDQYFGSTFYSGTATKVPPALKVPAGQVNLSASAHAQSSVSQKLVLSERTGAISNPFEYSGTLTMVYDANARISGGSVTVTNRKGRSVTHALTGSGYYSSSYFYTTAKIDKTTFGLGASASGGSFSGWGFPVNTSKPGQWVLSTTP